MVNLLEIIKLFSPTDWDILTTVHCKQKRMNPHSTRLDKESHASVIIDISILAAWDFFREEGVVSKDSFCEKHAPYGQEWR